VGKYAATEAAKATQRGVVYTVAPSPLDGHRIWAGTDDGLIHVTPTAGRAGRRTPAPLRDRPWSKVSLIEASHFDAQTAYAAINAFRSTTCVRTSTGRATAARPGPGSSPGSGRRGP
jgi:hypothetical protein